MISSQIPITAVNWARSPLEIPFGNTGTNDEFGGTIEEAIKPDEGEHVENDHTGQSSVVIELSVRR